MFLFFFFIFVFDGQFLYRHLICLTVKKQNKQTKKTCVNKIKLFRLSMKSCRNKADALFFFYSNWSSCLGSFHSYFSAVHCGLFCQHTDSSHRPIKTRRVKVSTPVLKFKVTSNYLQHACWFTVSNMLIKWSVRMIKRLCSWHAK